MAPSMAWWGVGHGVVGGSESLLVLLEVPGVILEHFQRILGAIWCNFLSYFLKFLGTLSYVFIADISARLCRRNACMGVLRQSGAVLTA